MLRYIVEKNGGTVTYDNETKTATVTIGDKTVEYSGKIINGRMVVDSNQLCYDFGLTLEQSTHLEGDAFETADEAALAFSLMYNPISIAQNWEYICNIYSTGKSFTFEQVDTDRKSSSVRGFKVDSSYGTYIGYAHTHSKYINSKVAPLFNDVFSNADKKACLSNCVAYVATPGGFFERYDAKTGKITVLSNLLPRDPKHPRNIYD